MATKSLQQEIIRTLQDSRVRPILRYCTAHTLVQESSESKIEKAWLEEKISDWLMYQDKIIDCLNFISDDPRPTIEYPELFYEEIGSDSDN